MFYRSLGKSAIEVSGIGLGLEHVADRDEQTIMQVIHAAMDHGVNYMDAFMPQSHVRDAIGKALIGRRDRAVLAGHLGSILEGGQPSRTTDTKRSMEHYEDMLRRCRTDYMDVALLFYIDTEEDADKVLAPGGLLEAAQKLKQKGAARAIGFSSHVPGVALRLVLTGQFDAVMFPVNPAGDSVPAECDLDGFFSPSTFQEGRQGIDPVRAELYRTCERMDVGIVTMKTFFGGWLLREDSPLGAPLTPVQCLHYALSQQGVKVAQAGCRTVAEVEAAIAYLTATGKEKDFSAISRSKLWALKGACTYCNHCLPCPVNIDIAAVTRLLDAGRQKVTHTLQDAYGRLSVPASRCIQCGICAKNCPFGVDAPGNMVAAVQMFE